MKIAVRFFVGIAVSLCVMAVQAQGTKRMPMLMHKKKVKQDFFRIRGDQEKIDSVISKALYYFKSIQPTDTSVILFDVDNTALYMGNWAQAAMSLHRQMPAIAEVLDLYHELVNLGFKIVFVTARPFPFAVQTRRNLIDVGYTKFEQLLTRALDDKHSSSREMYMSISKFKRRKWQQLLQEGYVIVGSVGNNETDFGPETGYAVRLPNYPFMP